MSATAATPDPTMKEISDAVVLGRAGAPESARRDLLAVWQRIGVSGDPFHRCTLAHYLADLYENPAEALIWDVRALDAADALTDERAQQHHAGLHVTGFYPSLFLNIADNLRRLGAFDVAMKYIANAEQHGSVLGDDDYGKTVRTATGEVRQAIVDRDTARRDSSPTAVE